MTDDGVPGPTSVRARIVALPLDPVAGPTCRAVLVHAGDRSRLVLGLHHAVGDGRALLCLLDDLRLLYLGLDADDHPVVDVDWSPRTARGCWTPTASTGSRGARMTRDAVDRWSTLQPSTHLEPTATDIDNDLGFVDCAVALDPFELRAAQSSAPDSGWPRNAVLLALLERAWGAVMGEEGGRASNSDWLVAVDARRAFGTTKGVGNLSGLEPVCLRGGACEDRSSLAHATGDALRGLRRPGAGLIAELAASWAGRDAGPVLNSGIRVLFATRAPELRLHRIFSHLDRIPDSLAEWGDATGTGVHWMPDPRIVRPIVAAMSTTFLGRTVLTIVASTRTCSQATADELAEHVVHDLAAWSAAARGAAR